jgi:nucleotide-binding universal stress UspA family protein
MEHLSEGRITMNPTVIQCPIELSANGRSALMQAVELARWYDAELHVAHVRGGRARLQPANEPLGIAGIDQRLSSFMEAVDTEGLRLSMAALAGDPVTAVTEHAQLIDADLVVVPRHGRRYGAYWRPGVYAKDLARTLTCPTLAVPDTGPPDPKSSFVNILCPTDFSAASRAALQEALILAQQSGGRLTLLHVLEGFPYGTVYSGGEAFRLIDEYRGRADRISRQMRGEVPSEAFNWCHIDTSVVSGVAHQSIVSAAAELDADLIVMGLPERSGIDRVIIASTATPVLRNARCPVLMVRATAGDVSRVTAGKIVAPEATFLATEDVSVEPAAARS